MISAESLSAAVERGVITAAQAQNLRAIEDERTRDGAEPADEERLRFITGFGDIFVTLGLVLFLSASAYFLFSYGSALAMYAGLAVLSWLLAEFFSRVRRMALPSITLLVVFVVSVLSTAVIELSRFALQATPDTLYALWNNGSFALSLSGLVTAAAAALHYARFKVPITIAAGTAALALSAVTALNGLAPSIMRSAGDAVILIVGFAIFALAMRFDTSDPERVTRRTDIAFWLHLVAAPLIVHPIVSGMLRGVPLSDTGSAMAVLSIFALLSAVALLVDRRALLVSGLLYAGASFATLLRQIDLSYSSIAAATMLGLGAFVLILSAGWRPLRKALLAIIPRSLSLRLPPPSVMHT